MTRKAPTRIHKRIVNSITNPAIKELYDNKKPPRENLKNLGVTVDPNNGRRLENTDVQHPAFMGYLQQIAENPVRKERKPISDFEERYISFLLKKFGTNVKKMAMDIELNSMQYTVAQLEKLIQKYNDWQEMKAKREGGDDQDEDA